MLANRSAINLDLTGRWVQEGYNNCMSASDNFFSGQPVLGGYNICWPTGLQ